MRRVGWHLQRVRGAVDRRFFAQLLGGAFLLVLIAATLITLLYFRFISSLPNAER